MSMSFRCLFRARVGVNCRLEHVREGAWAKVIGRILDDSGEVEHRGVRLTGGILGDLGLEQSGGGGGGEVGVWMGENNKVFGS